MKRGTGSRIPGLLPILIMALASAMPSYAKQWTMLNAGDDRCMDSASVAMDVARSGLRPVTSSYEMTQELGREHLPFSTHVTRDTGGKVNAVQIIVSGSTSVFWFPTRDLCVLS